MGTEGMRSDKIADPETHTGSHPAAAAAVAVASAGHFFGAGQKAGLGLS